jgi:hypothetical protein
MKYLVIVFSLFGVALSHATSVAFSSSRSGPGVFNNTNTAKVANGSLIRVGMINNSADPAGSFVEFGTLAVNNGGGGPNIVPGKVNGSVTQSGDDSTHNLFNNKTVCLWIYNTPTPGTAAQYGIFRTSRVFPVNNPDNVDDFITVESATEIVEAVAIPGQGAAQILPGDAVDSKHFVLGSPSTPPADADGDGLPDAWEASNGLNSSDPADALSDADGDTIDNRLEHALGSDPRSRSTPGLPVQGKVQIGQTDYATFQFTRLKGLAGSTLIPEISATLGSNDWHSGAADIATVSVTDQGLNEVVILRDTQPLASRTRLYFRLRLTVP